MKTTIQLNQEAIDSMMTDAEFDEYRAREEEDFKMNRWKYESLFNRAIINKGVKQNEYK